MDGILSNKICCSCSTLCRCLATKSGCPKGGSQHLDALVCSGNVRTPPHCGQWVLNSGNPFQHVACQKSDACAIPDFGFAHMDSDARMGPQLLLHDSIHFPNLAWHRDEEDVIVGSLPSPCLWLSMRGADQGNRGVASWVSLFATLLALSYLVDLLIFPEIL